MKYVLREHVLHPHLLLGPLLLLQHYGSSLLSHLQLIVLRQAGRGQTWGFDAYVHAWWRGPSWHHAHSLEHAHTGRHGWHRHRGHWRDTLHLWREKQSLSAQQGETEAVRLIDCSLEV